MGRDVHLEARQRIDDLLFIVLDLLDVNLRASQLIVSEKVCRRLLVVCQQDPRGKGLMPSPVVLD